MRPIYFPGLNGLRAIAALAVVVSHTTMALADFHLNPHIFGTDIYGHPKGINLAGFGVSIFFALSGFLITYLLLLEDEKTNINIGNFYIRRILRIWPLYYLYLAISLLIVNVLGMPWSWASLGFYIFYAANVPFILGTTIPFLAHYWSLAVEEQFYLFWPLLLKTCRGSFFSIITGAALTLEIAKLCSHFWPLIPYLDLTLRVARFQCMMIGGLGAMLYHRRNIAFMKLTTHGLTQFIAWASVLLMAANRFHVASVIDDELVAFIAVALIMGQITGGTGWVNLEQDSFDFLGKISYGIYVVHPLIIFMWAKLIGNAPVNAPVKYLLVYSGVLGTTILTAHLSYEYFEKRFLLLKHRFSAIPSSSTKNDALGCEARANFVPTA